jgi:hypothetical protein
MTGPIAMRYRVRALHQSTGHAGNVMDTVLGWYDTQDAAEAAAREYEHEYPQARVEIIREDGNVMSRLN